MSGESGRLMTQRYRDKYFIESEGPLPPETIKDLDLAYEVSARVNQMVPCELCGVCCHQKRIIIQDHEITRISEHLGLNEDVFRDEYLFEEGGRWFFSRTDPCHFLNESKRCMIQDVKPEICNDAPFLTTQFIGAVFYLLQYQREGLVIPILGNFILDDSPCSRKAAKVVSEEIAMVLARDVETVMETDILDSPAKAV